MFRRLLRFIFLCLVFVSGALVGGINTSKAIAYASQVIDNNNVEQQELKKKKPKPIKKKQQHGIRVV
jgi:hypothetical protein